MLQYPENTESECNSLDRCGQSDADASFNVRDAALHMGILNFCALAVVSPIRGSELIVDSFMWSTFSSYSSLALISLFFCSFFQYN